MCRECAACGHGWAEACRVLVPAGWGRLFAVALAGGLVSLGAARLLGAFAHGPALATGLVWAVALAAGSAVAAGAGTVLSGWPGLRRTDGRAAARGRHVNANEGKGSR